MEFFATCMDFRKLPIYYFIFIAIFPLPRSTQQSLRSRNIPESRASYIYLCEGQKQILECASTSEVIFIENAFYGRIHNTTCVYPGQRILPYPCSSHRSFFSVWKSCNGQRRCLLIADKQLFGDPCLGANGYLHVKYTCASPGRSVFGSCPDNSWGEWLNTDKPLGDGDFELFVNHKRNDKVCQNPTGLELRLENGDPYILGRDAVRTGVRYGATCVNSQQDDGQCNDYKVRYCCQKASNGCKRPATPQNGFLSSGNINLFSFGSRLRFSCRRGYKLIGKAYSVCLSTSLWSSAVPVCKKTEDIDTNDGMRYCFSRGFPHYQTFDGKRYKFGGICTYTLATTIRSDGLQPFSVEVENSYESERNEKTWIRNIIIRLFGHEIKLSYGHRVTVDSVFIRLPYHIRGKFEIRYSGNYVIFETDFGHYLLYDGRGYVALGLSGEYGNRVEGLCGNNNGEASDDFIVQEGRVVIADVFKFGNHYLVPTERSCPEALDLIDSKCLSSVVLSKHRQACSIFTDREAPLVDCYSADSDTFQKDCIYDMCAHNGSLVALEYVVAGYVDECHKRGKKPEKWRTFINTPMNCQIHSSYQLCATRCPETCTNPQASVDCGPTCVEGCTCDEGFVLDGTECVLKSECGCEFQGNYYKNGEAVLTQKCSQKCACKSGKMTCEKNKCEDNQPCVAGSDGVESCGSSGVETCRAWGAPHFMTFDGSGWYDFIGLCSYLMSETFNLPVTDSRWFSVEATSDSRLRNKRFLYLRTVRIFLQNRKIEILMDKEGTVTVNGNALLGAKTELYTITHSGLSTIVTTKYGLEVSFTGEVMHIKLASNYMSKVRGLCGDYNGFAGDDLLLPSGTIANTYDEFVADYQLGSCQAQHGPLYVCSTDKGNPWSSNEYCGILSDANGPFKACHEIVASELFREKCVYDVCVTGGDKTVLSQVLEEYVDACRQKGVYLCNWREQSGNMSLKCPPHSIYYGCAPSCQDTCSSPTASAQCQQQSIVEDCVCDFGYLREGNTCISKYDCGCVREGLYVGKGKVFIDEDKKAECKCLGFNRFTCYCMRGFNQQKNGKCVDINECNQRPGSACHFHADCFNTRGSYYCTCKEGLIGDGQWCQATSCSKLTPPSNARIWPIADHYPTNTRITYVCGSGYDMIGFPHRICENGTWTNKEPRCNKTTVCTKPPIIRNGRYRPQKRVYRIKEEIQYRCTRGFVLISSSSRRCNPDGTWSGPEPECRVQCPDPIIPLHGEVFSTKPVHIGNDWIEYTCDKGFKLTTARLRRCLDNGSWSGPEPSCQESGCGPPPVPKNGAFSPIGNLVWKVQSVVTYSCNEGYASVSWSPTRTTCLPTNNWSNSPPTCVDIDECESKMCKTEKDFENINDCITNYHECHHNAMCSNTPGSYVCQCALGYTGNGKDCSPFIPCAVPTNFEYGLIDPETDVVQVGEFLSFVCDIGYLLVGGERSQCQADGRWSQKFPACEDLDECSEDPCHVNATCLNIRGSFICICQDGYRGDGITECVVGDCDDQECGCLEAGTFSSMNEVFHTDGCTQQCICEFGFVDCVPMTCKPNEECTELEMGKFYCKEVVKCELEPRMTLLPEGCLDEDGKVQSYDAGTCTFSQCSGEFNDNCCGIAKQNVETIQCRSNLGHKFAISVNKVTECGCKRCLSSKPTLYARAFGIDKEGSRIPFELGDILRYDQVVAHTDRLGRFSLPIIRNQGEYLVKFVDRLGKFVPITKQLVLKKDDGSTFLDIKLPLNDHQTLEIDSQTDWDVNIGNSSLQIKSGSFFTKLGMLYKGKVSTEVKHINENGENSKQIVPGRYYTTTGKLLRFHEIFYCQFRGERNEALDAKNVQVFPSKISSEQTEDLNQLYLWNLNDYVGYWEKGRKFKKLNQDGKEVIMCEYDMTDNENTIAVASIEENLCYMNVRGYKTNSFLETEQLENVFVSASYERKGMWHTAVREMTSAMQGACLPLICNQEMSFTATISLSMNGNVTLRPDSKPQFVVDLSDLYRVKIEENSIVMDFERNAVYLRGNGPIYSSKQACFSASFDHSHFRFYLTSKDVIEFNTVPVDEFNIVHTWFSIPLIWWPKPMDFTSCYVKVGIRGSQTSVEVRSFAGQRSDILGRLYGTREDVSYPTGSKVSSAACVEFKCSGVSLDTIPDRTLIDIRTKANCKRSEVNSNLQYLLDHEYLEQRNNRSFRMFVPLVLPTREFGFYSFSSRDLIVSKQTAQSMCEDEMPDRGLAVTFDCP